ncbi:ORF1075 [White spot syndrome virus]|uniref:ORF1075 n=1 Tax=White spot syndrome virus TaxID=342409 RepID=A0A2D3I6U4_9VIRU|nr:ORF1075 [White spot syndrome virus]AYV99367.1 WSSV044 [White spot syndrome virus]
MIVDGAPVVWDDNNTPVLGIHNLVRQQALEQAMMAFVQKVYPERGIIVGAVEDYWEVFDDLLDWV